MTTPSQHPPSESDRLALGRLGATVRGLRQSLGLSRSELAARSGLSLRFLAQLESGEGNISYLRLRHVARAMNTRTAAILERAETQKERTVALLGMRGAGKSTVGRALSERLGVSLIELDELVEAEAGMPLGQIFELQGESFYRQLERELLARCFTQNPRAVLAAGGGIVTEPETYSLLRRHAYTVWLKATPQDHWDRVLGQGDRRPMQERPDAMAELERLWSDRAARYRNADLIVDTSGRPLEEVLKKIETAISGWLSPRRDLAPS